MTRYLDTVCIPVPDDDLDAYREMAAAVGEVWTDHGALEYFEGVASGPAGDGDAPGRSFADAADCGADESLVFGCIAFESEAHRDEVTEAVQQDPAYGEQFGEELPFDPARMVTGSFRQIVRYES